MEAIVKARNRRLRYSSCYFPYSYETLSDVDMIRDYIDKINNLTKEDKLEIVQINKSILESFAIKHVDLDGLHPIQMDEIVQSIIKTYYRYPKIVESILCIHSTKKEAIENTYAKAYHRMV